MDRATLEPAGRELVSAVLAEEPGALAAFEARYFGRAIASLRKMSLSPAEIDDVLQAVRVKLLLKGDDGRCRLEEYAGKGDLSALVRVIATRVAIDNRRRESRVVLDDELSQLAAADSDPRLSALRRQCRDYFAPALSAALARLEPRDRNLLRLHVVDGVTLEVLARSYRVHRSTVVRWLVKARESLVEALCDSLAHRAGFRRDELAELAREIRSQVELSLSRLLPPASLADSA